MTTVPPNTSSATNPHSPGSHHAPKHTRYAVLLSGTHVTGKETLAVALSQAFQCTWLKGEMAHNAATFGARSQARKGYNYGVVFGRIWLSKLRRLGFLSDGYESEGGSAGVKTTAIAPSQAKQQPESPHLPAGCVALITCYHMRAPARDAIRQAMLGVAVQPVFVVMNITQETLSGRTLGAEEAELAERIMSDKAADIALPLEEEQDVVLIDSMQDVDGLYKEITEAIPPLLALIEADQSS